MRNLSLVYFPLIPLQYFLPPPRDTGYSIKMLPIIYQWRLDIFMCPPSSPYKWPAGVPQTNHSLFKWLRCICAGIPIGKLCGYKSNCYFWHSYLFTISVLKNRIYINIDCYFTNTNWIIKLLSGYNRHRIYSSVSKNIIFKIIKGRSFTVRKMNMTVQSAIPLRLSSRVSSGCSPAAPGPVRYRHGSVSTLYCFTCEI